MKKKVTAVFDIGKTNKKFFLFDQDFKEVFREYTKFDQIVDQDGYPTEDLHKLQIWLKAVFNRILASEQYDIKAINFSSYGALSGQLDEDGEAMSPVHNYIKPISEEIVNSFYQSYGPALTFIHQIGASKEALLSAGMQLYWLKYTKPEVFKKIKYS